MVACEELRLFGIYEKISEKITNFAQTVPALFEQVLERLELVCSLRGEGEVRGGGRQTRGEVAANFKIAGIWRINSQERAPVFELCSARVARSGALGPLGSPHCRLECIIFKYVKKTRA